MHVLQAATLRAVAVDDEIFAFECLNDKVADDSPAVRHNYEISTKRTDKIVGPHSLLDIRGPNLYSTKVKARQD